jgi:hypothetical protein
LDTVELRLACRLCRVAPFRSLGYVLPKVRIWAGRNRADEDHAPYSLGVASSIEHCEAAAPRVAEKGELLNAEGPPDGLQVLDMRSTVR